MLIARHENEIGSTTYAAPKFPDRKRTKTKIELIQLLEGKVPTDEDLRTIKSYADGVEPNTRLVIPASSDGTLLAPTDLVARAHAAGLLDLGVDGIFTDFADAAARALKPAATSRR